MSVNKAILIGNVGKDPEVRPVSGNKVANFTLATSEKAYTKNDGTQVQERTEWHNIVVWGKLADVCEKYVRKGSKLYIEGKIRSRTYDDKQGQERKVTEIIVDNMEMLGAAPQTQQQAPQAAYAPPQPIAPQPIAPQPLPSYQPPAAPAPLDDDLPF